MSTNKETTENSSFFQKYPWLKWLLIVPIIAAAFYFSSRFIPKDFEKSSVFTQYGELSKDTIASTIPPVENVETDSITLDTAQLANQETTGLDTMKATIDSKNNKIDLPVTTKSNLDTPIQRIQIETPIIPNNYLATPFKSVHFEDFFSEENLVDSLQYDYRPFFNQNMITSKTVLKILAITGKEVLLGGNTEDAKEIFESIVEEQKIQSVTLCDRNGKVIYTSNAKYLNKNIKTVFPNLDLTTHSIGQGSDNHWITGVAIYHTYGQIGTVVLISE